MSSEERIAEGIDISVAGGQIGADTLLQDDPGVRAAYSGNPGFTEGADTPHPITSAKLSMFAQAEIVEAMEAVHLYSSNGTGEFHLDGIDPETALGGLKWLRKNMDSESVVRRGAINTRDVVEAALRRQEERRSLAAARAANHASGQTEVDEVRAGQLRHEAKAKEQIDAVFTGAPETIDGIDLSTVAELTGMLGSREGDDGVVVEDNRAFLRALSKRVGVYMGDPTELLKDFKALIACTAFIRLGSDEGDDYGIAREYLDHTEIGMIEILGRTSYLDFSEEVMDMWFDALASEPEEPIYEGAHATWASVAHEVMSKTKVLANSLVMVAQKDPHEYVSTLHAFADKGLDPSDSPRFQMTTDTIRICLSNYLASIELNQAALAAEEGTRTQRQAMDVRLSLQAAGLSGKQIAGSQDVNKLTKEEIGLVCSLYPMSSMIKVMGMQSAVRDPADAIMLDDAASDRFRAQALSLGGRPSTIYGRISGQIRR